MNLITHTAIRLKQSGIHHWWDISVLGLTGNRLINWWEIIRIGMTVETGVMLLQATIMCCYQRKLVKRPALTVLCYAPVVSRKEEMGNSEVEIYSRIVQDTSRHLDNGPPEGFIEIFSTSYWPFWVVTQWPNGGTEGD